MSMRIRHQGGFSLLENLIAMLVMSFGILACLSLQVVAAANVQSASQRSIAAQLAEDLLERIRAQLQARSRHEDVHFLQHWSDTPASGCTDASPSCSGGEMSGFEIQQWKQTLNGAHQQLSLGGETLASGGLVDPVACFFGPDAGSQGYYRIVLVWRSTMATSNPHLDDPQIDGCGNESDRYGPGNVYRQVLSLGSYMAAGR